MKKLLLIGGGGHCHSVLDSVLKQNQYDEIGIIDRTDTSALEIPVVGSDEDLPGLFRDGWTDAFISVGSVGNTALRRRLYKMVTDIGFYIPVIQDPTAVIANGVRLGQGVFVGKNAVINTNSIIG